MVAPQRAHFCETPRGPSRRKAYDLVHGLRYCSSTTVPVSNARMLYRVRLYACTPHAAWRTSRFSYDRSLDAMVAHMVLSCTGYYHWERSDYWYISLTNMPYFTVEAIQFSA